MTRNEHSRWQQLDDQATSTFIPALIVAVVSWLLMQFFDLHTLRHLLRLVMMFSFAMMLVTGCVAGYVGYKLSYFR